MSRLPRFKRSSEIPALRLTERDEQILKYVHRHRFLRSNHIVALVGGSRQQVLRRLQRLFHHGFLDRPTCQIDYYKSGSRRMAYGLDHRGAAWLRHQQSLPFQELHWKQKHFVGKLYLEHTLMIADIMVAVELACRKRTDIRLLIVSDLNLSKRKNPLQWAVTLKDQTRCGVIPDQVFGLEHNGQQIWYFLEADRGTMPVTRQNFDKTSVQRKLLSYQATWMERIHERVLGIRRFRILTVTTDAARVRKMIDSCPVQGHGLFLFTDLNTFLEQPDLFSHRWQTLRGANTLFD